MSNVPELSNLCVAKKTVDPERIRTDAWPLPTGGVYLAIRCTLALLIGPAPKALTSKPA